MNILPNNIIEVETRSTSNDHDFKPNFKPYVLKSTLNHVEKVSVLTSPINPEPLYFLKTNISDPSYINPDPSYNANLIYRISPEDGKRINNLLPHKIFAPHKRKL